MYSPVCVFFCLCTHIYICTHTYLHAYVYTYIHTYIPMYMSVNWHHDELYLCVVHFLFLFLLLLVVILKVLIIILVWVTKYLWHLYSQLICMFRKTTTTNCWLFSITVTRQWMKDMHSVIRNAKGRNNKKMKTKFYIENETNVFVKSTC